MHALIPLVEQPHEFILDASRRRAGDLLSADSAGQRAEGVNFFCETSRREDGAMIRGDDGAETRVHGDEV